MKTVARQDLPSDGRIVVLNGPSSAGKSTLARELRLLLPDPYLHMQLDSFRAMEPLDYFRPGQAAVSALRLAALCRSMNAAAAEYARHGQHVFLDHVLPPEGWKYLADDLLGLCVILVGVRCELEILEERERQRGDRPIGLAAAQSKQIHAGCRYDIEVDTSYKSPAECARKVAEALHDNPRGGAFKEVVREHTAV